MFIEYILSSMKHIRAVISVELLCFIVLAVFLLYQKQPEEPLFLPNQTATFDDNVSPTKEHRTFNNQPPLMGREIAMEEKKGTELLNGSRMVDASNSGIRGTTSSIVKSGMEGGPTTGGPTSIEFAIAPIEGNTPAYHKALFITSDQQGKYEISLPPGRYWIGPKAKALDPMTYVPGPISFSEKVVVVKEGAFTHVDLSEVGHAP